MYDQYSWIRDDNWQEVLHSPNVLKKNIRKYIDDENKWTNKKLSFLKPLEKKIFKEYNKKIHQYLKKMVTGFITQKQKRIKNTQF